jgi:hypothetical protein
VADSAGVAISSGPGFRVEFSRERFQHFKTSSNSPISRGRTVNRLPVFGGDSEEAQADKPRSEERHHHGRAESDQGEAGHHVIDPIVKQ